jgi:hypothetical protein
VLQERGADEDGFNGSPQDEDEARSEAVGRLEATGEALFWRTRLHDTPIAPIGRRQRRARSTRSAATSSAEFETGSEQENRIAVAARWFAIVLSNSLAVLREPHVRVGVERRAG